MHNWTEIIDGYFECWNTDDAIERAEAVERVWAEDATSADQRMTVTGRDELIAMFANFREEFVGHQFRVKGEPNEHNDAVCWAWELCSHSGDVLLSGIDVATVDATHRISTLLGFFGAIDSIAASTGAVAK